MEPSLTIAIPTYNRAGKLQAQLDRLIPQLEVGVCCRVYDNASTDETRQIVEKYQSPQILYSRSQHNYGAERNFLRCFEECDTEWVWVLSDDDPVLPGAVAELMQLLRNCQCDFIHTSTGLCKYARDIIVSDVGQLLQESDLGALNLISEGVYRMSAFRPILRVFISSISTWAAQLVTILTLIEARKSTILLSPVELLTNGTAPLRWSTLDFIIRFCQLPNFLTRPANQRLLAEKIWLDVFHWALLTGLRETDDAEGIQKWKRCRRLVPLNLGAFHARSPLAFAARNWFRPEHCRRSFTIFYVTVVLTLLGWCPAVAFPRFRRLFPSPPWQRGLLICRKHQFVRGD